jgi:hypothetical protein
MTLSLKIRASKHVSSLFIRTVGGGVVVARWLLGRAKKDTLMRNDREKNPLRL